MKNLRFLKLLLVCAFTLPVPSVLSAQTGVTALNVVAPEREFPSVRRSYQSMDAVFSRDGILRTVRQVRQVRIGASKTELVRAVGRPVSAYGDGSWNFNISLDFPQTHRLICQYRVYFDQNERVSGTAWRRPQCADIIIGRTR